MHQYRSHNCGQLRKPDVGSRVRVAGWVHSRRDHGGVLFIDLRDHYGLTQVVIYPDKPFQDAVAHLSKETVIRFDGTVAARTAENINPRMPTGEIEIDSDSYEVLGSCEHLPFSVFPEDQVPEELALKYRYLSLRRGDLHQNILLRSRVISSLRKRMIDMGFTEFQTPILTSSSPEGARDFLVPSRLHPGTFYALPQAPQQFKQLLMVSGFDRYFQIAPCFRDEDARADRSPGEFYQLDIEMSFVTQDDIFAALESLLAGVFAEFSNWAITKGAFPRYAYDEAMLKFGTDKPDLRIPIEICDVSEIFRTSGFKVFSSTVEAGGVVRAIPVRGIADKPRSFFDKIVEYAQSIGSQGLAYLNWNPDSIKGPLTKHLTPEQISAIEKACGVQKGDVVFFVGTTKKNAQRIAGDLRVKLGTDLGMIEKDAYRFCWIVDFPMYEYDELNKCITFCHNPFSMPQGGLEALNSQDPLTIKAFQYDIVCNGVELSSGAIRNHRPDVMYKAFEIAGYPQEEVDRRFGGMISAFKFGAPPHGGIAPGIDRMVMLLAHTQSIREIIAFPMNQRAQDLMMNAPGAVSDKQLKELSIKVTAAPQP